MDNDIRIEKQKELVEQIGRFYDKEGLQPIAGRILGLLIVMDQEQYTFDEIVDHLKISKSSASTAIRNLEALGHIEYVTLSGDRKRYFRQKTKNALNIIDDFERKMMFIKKFMMKALELKDNKESRNSLFIKDHLIVIDFIISQLSDWKLPAKLEE